MQKVASLQYDVRSGLWSINVAGAPVFATKDYTAAWKEYLHYKKRGYNATTNTIAKDSKAVIRAQGNAGKAADGGADGGERSAGGDGRSAAGPTTQGK
jgi:hypothetical protein